MLNLAPVVMLLRCNEIRLSDECELEVYEYTSQNFISVIQNENN